MAKKRTIAGGGALAVVIGLLALWLSTLIGGVGPGGHNGGGTDSSDNPEAENGEAVVVPDPPPENEFRLEDNTIYHGTTPLELEELVRQSRRLAEDGKPVKIVLVSYDQLHFNQLERALDNAAVAYTVERP